MSDTLEFRDPPPIGHRAAQVEGLKERPGEWACMESFHSPGPAYDLAKAFRTRFEGVEAVTRRCNPSRGAGRHREAYGADVWEVFARWIGDVVRDEVTR